MSKSSQGNTTAIVIAVIALSAKTFPKYPKEKAEAEVL